MNYVVSSPIIDIFLYVAQVVERVPAVAFGNELHGLFKKYQTLIFPA